jgi:hypothetical protein
MPFSPSMYLLGDIFNPTPFKYITAFYRSSSLIGGSKVKSLLSSAFILFLAHSSASSRLILWFNRLLNTYCTSNKDIFISLFSIFYILFLPIETNISI